MNTHAIHSVKHHNGAPTAAPAAKHHADLVQQAQKWVSQTFFGSMLKEMRKSPFKSEMFSGGRGGDAFSEMFDQQLADHMGTGSGKKLVNALVHKMEGAQAMPAVKKSSVPVASVIQAYTRSNQKAGAQ